MHIEQELYSSWLIDIGGVKLKLVSGLHSLPCRCLRVALINFSSNFVLAVILSRNFKNSEQAGCLIPLIYIIEEYINSVEFCKNCTLLVVELVID